MSKKQEHITALLVFIITSCVVLLLWTYRLELARMVYGEPAGQAVTAPEAPKDTYGTEITLMADGSGHYYLDAEVQRTSVDFMIDTGASISVLSYDDAKRVGIDVRRLENNISVMTGAGQKMFARTTVDYVRSGHLRVNHLDVLVAREDAMPKSVLGANFLRQLTRFSVEGGKMVLVP